MSPIELLFFGFAAATVAFALISGENAERIAALLLLFGYLSTQVVFLYVSSSQRSLTLLATDAILALGFIFIALKYMYRWLALMMFSISGCFAIHAFYISTSRGLDRDFAFFSNIATGFALLALAIGVWTSRRRAAVKS